MTRADDSGSGSILAVGIVATVIALTSLLLPLGAVFIARHQATAAADAAALAAADVAVGIVPGHPCQAAAVVATANRASATGCRVEDLVVTVRVAVPVLDLPVLGLRVQAIATAGPPESARGAEVIREPR